MSEARLYFLQRASAFVLAPLVIVHIAVVIYAVEDGIGAAEILARTRGSVLWGLFYGAFVLAVAVHASIGLRNIIGEWTAWKGRGLDRAAAGFGLVLVALGLRAVWAVVA